MRGTITAIIITAAIGTLAMNAPQEYREPPRYELAPADTDDGTDCVYCYWNGTRYVCHDCSDD